MTLTETRITIIHMAIGYLDDIFEDFIPGDSITLKEVNQHFEHCWIEFLKLQRKCSKQDLPDDETSAEIKRTVVELTKILIGEN